MATKHEMRRIAPVMPYVAAGAIPFDAETRQLTRRFLERAWKDMQSGKGEVQW